MKKFALITGASSGIGFELARIMASQKHNLILVARNETKLRELAEELIKLFGVDCMVLAKDLSLPSSVDEIYRELEAAEIKIEILVNNAGFGNIGKFWENDWVKEQRMIEVNIMALTKLTRLFLPGMVSQKSGKILNVASTAAFQPGPFMAVYYASKAFVLFFSEALAEELKGTGVTVTALCPGPTSSGFQDEAAMNDAKLLKLLKIAPAVSVARYAYNAMMHGRKVAIHGFLNNLMVFSQRFTPRQFAVKAIAYLQKQ
jgi:uncharacterized protein